mmetsp:Transcript_2942/g.8853  ORF Transcript_2942/g.8853 Transcript_2942/m.8853 type:complete len:292 (-) Transcript_2942:1508-2383(-)
MLVHRCEERVDVLGHAVVPLLVGAREGDHVVVLLVLVAALHHLRGDQHLLKQREVVGFVRIHELGKAGRRRDGFAHDALEARRHAPDDVAFDLVVLPGLLGVVEQHLLVAHVVLEFDHGAQSLAKLLRLIDDRLEALLAGQSVVLDVLVDLRRRHEGLGAARGNCVPFFKHTSPGRGYVAAAGPVETHDAMRHVLDDRLERVGLLCQAGLAPLLHDANDEPFQRLGEELRGLTACPADIEELPRARQRVHQPNGVVSRVPGRHPLREDCIAMLAEVLVHLRVHFALQHDGV